jgi:putative IMPACT (imprinted ancient) family translation regulator
MDFDNKFNERYSKFENILKEQSCKARVFLLGIDVKESEDLKKTLGYKNLEEISKILLENCPKEESKEWNNKHLKCNLREIEKMKSINIFDWLFVK